MPFKLLRDIPGKTLPWTIEAADDIEKVRALRASGHAAAFVSAPGSAKPYARVLALTPKGREELQRGLVVSEAIG
ncbi:MAG: hypothetical protein JWP29_2194 [Rhodoferax sp.]|jgi:hypothetical protein|nr:hypothetical protein [Rhodoferax sp.]